LQDDLLGEDLDIFFARSTNNGATWSGPDVLNSTGLDDAPDASGTRDTNADVAFVNSEGAWLALWSTRHDFGNSGIEGDIASAFSEDGGVTWSEAALVNSNANGDTSLDVRPRIACDGRGNCVAVWESQPASGGDNQIFSARTVDGGKTWEPAFEISVLRNGSSDSFPAIATDQAGNWMAMWNEDDLSGSACKILMARSTDNGVTWTIPEFVISDDLPLEQCNGTQPGLATSGAGVWMVAVASSGVSGDEVLAVSSRDNGLSWGSTALIASGSLTVGTNRVDLVSDRSGNWVTAWSARIVELGNDGDILASRSQDGGQSWTAPVLLNVTDTLQASGDGGQTLATNGRGLWMGNWSSNHALDRTIGSDIDILFATTRFTGTLSGTVVAEGGAPVDCAVVVLESDAGDTVDVAATDLTGSFHFGEVAAGTYRLRVAAPTYAGDETDVTIAEDSDVVQDFLLEPGAFQNIIFGNVADADTGTWPIMAARVQARIANEVVAVTYTCADGRYELLSIPLAKQGKTLVTLEVEAAGYVAQFLQVYLTAKADLEQDVALEKAALFPSTLTGVVQDGDSGPGIADARVQVSGPTSISTDVAGDGTYAFPALLEGQYTVVASAIGFTTQNQIKILPSGEVEELNFELSEQGAGDPTDINGDISIDAVDVQLVINAVLGLDIGALDADVNADASTDAIDVQLVINAVLGV
jgi:hypothetical protein